MQNSNDSQSPIDMLNQSDEVKDRLREIYTLTSRMCLNKDQQLEFAKFLIEKYLSTNKEDEYSGYEADDDQSEEIKLGEN